MKKVVMKAGVWCLKICYAPMSLCKVQNKITFISRQSSVPSIDIRMLTDYFIERHPEIECDVLVKMLKTTPRGIIGYFGHLLRQAYALATSKVVIIDGYCIAVSVLNHKPETSVIQIWHSLAAIKKFGYQTIDLPAGHSHEVAEVMRMHCNYDYLTCPSEATGKLFCRAMNVDEDKLVFLGLPRIDEITNKKPEDRNILCREYGIDERKRLVLYAPTFRKGQNVQVKVLADSIDKEKYKLVVKLHPVYKEQGDIPEGVICDEKHNTYEWLKACDAVVTDYSALGLEAALTGKPVYFYLYDLEEYEKTVGLNINPLKEMAWAASVDARAIAKMLEEEYDYDALNDVREKYFTIDTDNCTEQFAEFVLELMH